MSNRDASEESFVKKTIVKSFRLDERDNELLLEIHSVYRTRHASLVKEGNMSNIHRWTLANTLQTLIRDTYKELEQERFSKVE